MTKRDREHNSTSSKRRRVSNQENNSKNYSIIIQHDLSGEILWQGNASEYSNILNFEYDYISEFISNDSGNEEVDRDKTGKTYLFKVINKKEKFFYVSSVYEVNNDRMRLIIDSKTIQDHDIFLDMK